MDQMSKKFDNSPKSTNKNGTKTITILASKSDKRRCTTAITITVLGIQLPNMVIFHCTATAQIGWNKLATTLLIPFMQCREKLGWMLSTWMSGLTKFWHHTFLCYYTMLHPSSSLTCTTDTWCQLWLAESRTWRLRSRISQEDVLSFASLFTWALISHSRASFGTFKQIFRSQTDLWMETLQAWNEFKLQCE